MATPIGTLGTIPTLTIGGRVFTDLSTLKILTAYVITGARKGTFRAPNGSAGYTVTALKTLTIQAMEWDIAAAAGANPSIVLAQTDNDLGMDGTGALTNPSYFGGDAGNYIGNQEQIPTAGRSHAAHPFFAVAAGKYLTMIPNTAQTYARAYGYET